ncbi:hypothetical protein HG440_003425 [Candidatus Saccharibacteria bacterium]|nr:hypothetical protein [Candidatus Saccharibacteria bacterium]
MVTLLSLTMNRLLLQLRDAALDENEPTAGLLRKCLFLGSDVGSERLRSWAESELNGYGDEDELPVYRSIPAPILLMDSQSGYTWVENQIVNRLQVPPTARKYLLESLEIRQPLAELQELSMNKSVRFSTPRLAIAAHCWNQELEWPQQIMQLKYTVPGATIKGVLDRVRTILIELIIDLTAKTPLEELPTKQTVDSIMEVIIQPAQPSITNNITGDNNQVTIGDGNTQYIINQQVGKLKADLQAIRDHVSDRTQVDRERAKEIAELADDIEATIDSPSESTDEKRQSLTQRLYAFASETTNTGFQALLSGAAQGIATLAAQGFFG